MRNFSSSSSSSSRREQHQSVEGEEKIFFFFLPSHCSPLSLCTTHSDLKPIGQRRFFLEAKGRIWGQIRPLSLRSTRKILSPCLLACPGKKEKKLRPSTLDHLPGYRMHANCTVEVCLVSTISAFLAHFFEQVKVVAIIFRRVFSLAVVAD